MTDRIIPQAEYDIDLEPPATAADWLEPAPEDRHPYGFEPRTYVTDSVLGFGDDGVHRSRVRGPEPGPDPAVFGPGRPPAEVLASWRAQLLAEELEPEEEAEPEWDSADSAAYQARAEAGLELEAEP